MSKTSRRAFFGLAAATPVAGLMAAKNLVSGAPIIVGIDGGGAEFTSATVIRCSADTFQVQEIIERMRNAVMALTDPAFGLDNTTVRVTHLEEGDGGMLEFTVEEQMRAFQFKVVAYTFRLSTKPSDGKGVSEK
jgi:hypothetical protein